MDSFCLWECCQSLYSLYFVLSCYSPTRVCIVLPVTQYECNLCTLSHPKALQVLAFHFFAWWNGGFILSAYYLVLGDSCESHSSIIYRLAEGVFQLSVNVSQFGNLLVSDHFGSFLRCIMSVDDLGVLPDRLFEGL